MSTPKVTSIHAGFLSGNLGLDESVDVIASIQAYADACQAAIEAEYPGAEVEIDWQDASGSVPIPLQPSATGGTSGDESDAVDVVRDIMQRVFEQGDFYRDVAKAEAS